MSIQMAVKRTFKFPFIFCYIKTFHRTLLDNWEERSPMLQMRMNHSMAEVQNNLYVIGGNVEDNYGFPVPVIAIEKYCPVANQWTLCQRSF
jgi:kelch-like protein 9/13